jgi:DNA-binding NarL/FixJ family response regulator
VSHVSDTPRRDRPLRVLVVDDNEAFRHAIAEVINAEPDMEVVAEAPDGEQALWLAKYLRPARLDLVLMDIEMPRLNGLKATERMNAALPNLPIVMLTVSTLDGNLFDALRAGAVGYLSKGLASAALVRALRDFHREDALPMSRVMARKMLAYFQQRSNLPLASAAVSQLSPRQRDVLELIARGERDREIAQQLVIAERTVKKHVENILHKLHARNRAEAAARLREYG